MTRSLVLSALAGTCLAVVAACTNSPATTKATDERIGFVACQEPRPEACTMHYDPVCGEVKKGSARPTRTPVLPVVTATSPDTEQGRAAMPATPSSRRRDKSNPSRTAASLVVLDNDHYFNLIDCLRSRWA